MGYLPTRWPCLAWVAAMLLHVPGSTACGQAYSSPLPARMSLLIHLPRHRPSVCLSRALLPKYQTGTCPGCLHLHALFHRLHSIVICFNGLCYSDSQSRDRRVDTTSSAQGIQVIKQVAVPYDVTRWQWGVVSFNSPESDSEVVKLWLPRKLCAAENVCSTDY